MQISSLQPHTLLLGLIKDSRISLGKNLLASCLIGEENERVRQLKLSKLLHFSSLPLYSKEDIYELTEILLQRKFIELRPLPNNKFAKVLAITEKGEAELRNPSDLGSLKKNGFHYKLETITDEDRQIFSNLGDFLSGLSDEQKKAIVCESKYILCIAGAGSGKTSVLTKRAWFLSTLKSVPQEKILCVTFTRKARQEMLHRLEKLIPNNLIQVETFNSFCEKILKKNEDAIYGRKVSVLDYKAKVKLILKALKEHDTSVENILDSYYGKKKLLSNDKTILFLGFVNDIFSVLDYYRNNSISYKELISLIMNHYDSDIKNIITSVLEKITMYKENSGFRDYTDQILHVIEFFKENQANIPGFEHILVDEYQDINSLQFELLGLLCPKNLFAVGDPRQSIYGWRGSKIDFILDFQDIYENAKILQLTRNFRSDSAIVSMCNKVIKEMKMPDLVSSKDTKGEINIINHPDDDSEALFITQSIISQNCKRNDIFVLARTNKQIEKIASVMDKFQVKYIKRTIEEHVAKFAEDDEITLSTIHAIKGMESEIVYVAGASTKNHPCKASEHPLLEAVKVNDTYDKFPEELRLFYVALSRAKAKLIINYSGALTSYINEDSKSSLKVNGNELKNEPVLGYKSNKAGSNGRLYNELKSWRYDKAAELKVPAYHIFNDRTLQEICEALPTSFDELREINGFGPYKVRMYGNEIVKIVLGNS